ncbi:MAG: TIGR00730 family Rossman fold protein [Saprospiraceae bacterium]
MTKDNSGEKETHPMLEWTERNISESAWTMFKVISEFVEGFETMHKIGPCVSIFGSARTKPDHPYYLKAVEIARLLTLEGFGVITGGGPGIMEAGNKGASIYGGKSVGLNIELPFETGSNQFVDWDKSIDFRYFFVRKVVFVKFAQAFIVLPGGLGTMDELFEVLTLVQTKKIQPIPIILVGSDFWGGLKSWIEGTMLAEGKISPGDMDLMPIVDEPEEAIKIIKEFYEKKAGRLAPNYDL